jgi:hypothetical protein
MHLFLGWRAMEDRISTVGYTIEHVLWGDSRARHTFLIACTDEYPSVLIEIDMGDREKVIHKSMKLNIRQVEELPHKMSQLELIGKTSSPRAFEHLIQSAQKYVAEHPNYHVLTNNCRTFVEYVIDQIPEFRNSLPRKDGSILEYYHSQAKHQHPGALVKSHQLLKDTRDFHRRNRQYKYAGKLVLDIQLPKENLDNPQAIEGQF